MSSNPLILAGNAKVLSIIEELSNINDSDTKLLTEVQDGVDTCNLTFSSVLWSKNVDDITRHIADCLDCKQTFYAYDKFRQKIIVTFNR